VRKIGDNDRSLIYRVETITAQDRNMELKRCKTHVNITVGEIGRGQGK
jgi:hypothetical protein